MKNVLGFLNSYLELYLCIALMCAMTLTIALQVFMRYVMQDSLSWSEELARYLFVWLIYLGISYGAKQMQHIKIDAALGLFPKKARPYVMLLGDVIFFCFAIFICYTSWKLVQKQILLGQRSPAIHMPMWILYAAPLVGFGLTAIREVQTIVYRCKQLYKGE